MDIRRRFSHIKWYLNTFSTISDIIAVNRLLNKKIIETKPKFPLHPRALLGKTVYCRPGTTDWATFRSTFDDQYHLPPDQGIQLSSIVDLGANVGYTAAHFACIYPDAKIFAVEMDFSNYELAKENTQHWQDRITLLHAAIWSSNGEVTYDCNSPQDAYKIQENMSPNSVSVDNHFKVVSAVSMDKLIEQNSIKQIDYLKVDIEGAENELFLSSPLKWLRLVTTLKVEIHRPQDLDKYLYVLTAEGFITYKDKHHWSTVIASRLPTPEMTSQLI